MIADDIIKRFRAYMADLEPETLAIEVQAWVIEDMIRAAWFAGHKQGLRDMREGWEAHLKAKAGETA